MMGIETVPIIFFCVSFGGDCRLAHQLATSLEEFLSWYLTYLKYLFSKPSKPCP